MLSSKLTRTRILFGTVSMFLVSGLCTLAGCSQSVVIQKSQRLQVDLLGFVRSYDYAIIEDGQRHYGPELYGALIRDCTGAPFHLVLWHGGTNLDSQAEVTVGEHGTSLKLFGVEIEGQFDSKGISVLSFEKSDDGGYMAVATFLDETVCEVEAALSYFEGLTFSGGRYSSSRPQTRRIFKGRLLATLRDAKGVSHMLLKKISTGMDRIDLGASWDEMAGKRPKLKPN